jgi:DNA uptake protein ComE-like DNA-binding protein
MTGDSFSDNSGARQTRHRRIQSFSFVIGAGLCVLLCGYFAVSDFVDAGPVQEVELTEKINPNFAPVGSLVRLPGIGIGRAGAIVTYRDAAFAKGGVRAFASCEDLQKVRGIGPATAYNIGQWLEFE